MQDAATEALETKSMPSGGGRSRFLLYSVHTTTAHREPERLRQSRRIDGLIEAWHMHAVTVFFGCSKAG
jgi:hypothetical protein